MRRVFWLHRQAHRTQRPGSRVPALLLLALVPFSALLVIVLIIAGAAASGIAAYDRISAGLPNLGALTRSTLPQTTRIYDRSGKHLLATLYVQDRDYVEYAHIPATIQNATVAVEDRGFWTNPGVDFGGVIRAALNNADGGALQGGSTITQQLVKQLLVGDQQTLDRKVREAVLATKASQVMPKSQIMELYLNTVYYGEQAYGVAAAARRYFGLHVGQLDLAETALLAGLPRAPDALDPFVHPKVAKARQAAVLEAMVETGMISAKERDAAIAEPWHLVRYALPAEQIPWFTDRAIEEASAMMGGHGKLASCGCKVITTLDWSLQSIAQHDVTTFIKALPAYNNAHNAALVAEDPSTGEVLAYVGSVDPKDDSPEVRGRFDAAGIGLRSPGSTWKAVTYLSAMQAGHLTDTSRLWDVSTDFAPGQLADPLVGTSKGYRAEDADGSTNGPITIRQAIRESRNIPAIRAMLAYGGVDDMIQMAYRLGVRTRFGPTERGPSLAIGTHSVTLTDMTAVYSTVSNEGLRVTQHKVRLIERPDGSNVMPAVQKDQVVDGRLAWTFLDILKDNANRNGSWLTGQIADLGRPAAVKTGTETDVRDTYTVGMVPQLAVGVWVGNTDNAPMAPTFHSYNGPLEI